MRAVEILCMSSGHLRHSFDFGPFRAYAATIYINNYIYIINNK